MRVSDNKWQVSSRDIWHSSQCDHCTRLAMAVAQKTPEVLEVVAPYVEDLDSKLQIIQGVEYEEMLFSQLHQNSGDEFLELPSFSTLEQTKQAISSAVPVIGQAGLEASFGTVTLVGFADLLVRDDHQLSWDTDGKLVAEKVRDSHVGYTVWDIKHSAKVKENYKLQVAGYLFCLEELGAASSFESGIVGSQQTIAAYDPLQLKSEFEKASKKLFGLLSQHPAGSFELGPEFEYRCPKPSICTEIYCTYPGLCAATRVEQDLLTQLYKLNGYHASYFAAAGVKTLAQLAGGPEESNVPKLKQDAYETYRRWARVIQKGKLTGKPEFELVIPAPEIASLLPEPNEGDMFFDLEWFAATGDPRELHYVFGVTNRAEEFEKFVSDDFDQERVQFEKFVRYSISQLERHPEAFIYHYNDPEPKRLELLVDRHGILSEEVQQINQRMFDLLPVARKSIINSFGSLGIKTLENFFDSPHAELAADGDQVEDGLESMLFFHRYRKALENSDPASAEELLEKIMQYNKADCVATSRLYDWLRTGLEGRG